MICDIISYEGSGILGSLIRYFTNTKIAHIAIMISDTSLIESGLFGVNTSTTIRRKGNWYILRYEGLTDAQKLSITNFLCNKINLNYDYKLFFGIGLNKVFGLKTKWDKKDKYICVELIVEAFKNIGIDLIPDKTDNMIIPNDLFESKLLKIIESGRD